MTKESSHPHIVVLGGGFGGLAFCQSYNGPGRITLIDRQNHHLFQPLLYQVATAGLSATDIAQPLRSILREKQALTVQMAEVIGIDLPARQVKLHHGEIGYDYLVIGLGVKTDYFARPEWARYTTGLKTLEDAMRIRREILFAYEQAETETNRDRQRSLMTTVVVGGGPTGVELAGTLAELAHEALHREFDSVDTRRARVILIEALPRLLSMFPEELSHYAEARLRQIGVEVRTGTKVLEIRDGAIELEGETLAAAKILWVAGVGASAFTRHLGVNTDKAGRILVGRDLSIPGRSEVFVIGDIASVPGEDGRPLPGIAPAAIQMGRFVARTLSSQLRGQVGPERAGFRYRDKGMMATIGRRAAVARIGRLRLRGAPAWYAWLGVHLISLVGFRNKLMVLIHWIYCYVARRPGARIITSVDLTKKVDPPPTSESEMVPR